MLFFNEILDHLSFAAAVFAVSVAYEFLHVYLRYQTSLRGIKRGRYGYYGTLPSDLKSLIT